MLFVAKQDKKFRIGKADRLLVAYGLKKAKSAGRILTPLDFSVWRAWV